MYKFNGFLKTPNYNQSPYCNGFEGGERGPEGCEEKKKFLFAVKIMIIGGQELESSIDTARDCMSLRSEDATQFAKNRAEAKQRQAFYKKSHLFRQYKKQLKREGYDDAEATENVSQKPGGKRPRVGVDGSDITEKISGVDKIDRISQRAKKVRIDPFSKEKARAKVSRDTIESERQRVATEEREKAKRISLKKKTHKKLSQRDSRGRPLVRNSISAILDKLQAEQRT